MSNLSIDVSDDVLAGLLVTANEKDTSLDKLVNKILIDYIDSHDAELLQEDSTNEPTKSALQNSQDLVESREKENYERGCCGDPEPSDSTDSVKPLTIDNSDLEASSIFNKPIGEKKSPPQGAPLYNKRVTNKWL